jgi:hypothetical protein
MGTGTLPPVKQPGRAVNHLPPSSVEGKVKVKLYLYSPLGLHGLFQGEISIYTVFIITTGYKSKRLFHISDKHTHPLLHSVLLHVNKFRLLLQLYYQYPPPIPCHLSAQSPTHQATDSLF